MKPFSDFRSRLSKILRAAWAGPAVLSLVLVCAPASRAATFGKVVPIGGHASDIALDEARGVLYVANFTANRIEVMNLADQSITRSFNVPAQPGSLALSPDGAFLIVTHYGPVDTSSSNSPSNGLTVINLTNNQQQRFTLGFPPLGVAFGNDGQALIATTVELILFSPQSGVARTLQTITQIAARALPVDQDGKSFPPQIVASSMVATPDGRYIVGTLGAGPDVEDRLDFVYTTASKLISASPGGSTPPMGPRVVSVARDASYFMTGWTLRSSSDFSLISQIPNITGDFNFGSHVIDSDRGVIYGQFPEAITDPNATAGTGSGAQQGTGTTTGSGGTATPTAPLLFVLDSDNLAVIEKLQLTENLAGKSLLDRASTTLYSISDSGVLIGPVADFRGVRRLRASKADLVFRGNFCDRKAIVQEFALTEANGGAVDFSLSSDIAGITITPTSGVTPAIVRVQVQPTLFANRQGTVTGLIRFRSTGSVNLPGSVRVLINTREPDQRGAFVNVAGRLVDVLADPTRNRVYVLRQDADQVLMFDGSNYTQIATVKTFNTPTQMAITIDGRYLLVGHDNAARVSVIDLETLRATPPVVFPRGHYPRSVAVSGRAILAAVRVAGDTHVIDRIDIASRRATPLSQLGVFKNDVHINTTLVASANGATIAGFMADGRVLLYEANSDTFTIARKDFTALAGTYAASNNGQFVVGNRLLNASMVQERLLEPSAGVAFVDETAVRTFGAAAGDPGTISRVNLSTGQSLRPTRTVEAPITEVTTPGFAFIRTLVPMASRQSLISLTQSGFTVIPWSYDAATPIPNLERIVNAADQTAPVAPGGLISIFGADLSPLNIATREIPLPTALADSCLTVNGSVIPLVFVSSNQINAQLPINVSGRAQLVLRAPAGVSNNLNFTIRSTAPSVFRSASEGSTRPVVIKDGAFVDEANPVRAGDELTIYATGMGLTSPQVEAGLPGPDSPLAETVIRPEVTLGEQPLEVLYSGLAPGQVGVYQLNVRVSSAVRGGGDVPLKIRQGESATELAIRVEE
ncbi:MAG: hypothetical protein ACKV22_39925 [Bryobacteraceae bacterium]